MKMYNVMKHKIWKNRLIDIENRLVVDKEEGNIQS